MTDRSENTNKYTAASTATDLEHNSDRLNFEEMDALNNDFDEEYVGEGVGNQEQKVHMTSAERMNKLFDDIGGFGRFQFFAYFVVSYGISGTGFFIYLLGYLIQQPIYSCTYNGEEPTEKICYAKNICAADDRIASWEIDATHELSLVNWQQKLDLMCATPWKVGFLGSAFFLGWIVTILWVPGMSDKRGRKKFWITGVAVNLILYTMLMTCTSLNQMICVLFGFGMNTSLRINVGYIYLMELMPAKSQTFVGTVWNIGEACIYLIGTIYFWQVSKDWQHVVMLGYAMMLFSFLGSFALPESPRLLKELNRNDEAKLALDTIAKWNKKHLSFYLHDFPDLQSPNITSGAEKNDHEMEISGLPSDISELKLRTFLEENCGAQYEKVLTVILSNDAGYVSNCELTKSFVSFQDENSMLQAIESLKGIGYQGYSLNVHRRKLKLPAINTPGIPSIRNNGENSGPIFLTNTPKNFEAATNFTKQSEESGPKSISFYLSQRKIQINLLIMTFIWLSTSFNFYLIQFLINTFEQVYLSAIGSATSEIAAYIFAGALYQMVGLQQSLFIAFGIAVCGGCALLTNGLNHPESLLFPIQVLVAKFGIACSFNILYVSHSTIFPVAFAATALGLCNFFARVFSAGSPVLAQIEEPLPVIAFTFTSVTACILALGIQTSTPTKQPEQKASKGQKQRSKGKKGKLEE